MKVALVAKTRRYQMKEETIDLREPPLVVYKDDTSNSAANFGSTEDMREGEVKVAENDIDLLKTNVQEPETKLMKVAKIDSQRESCLSLGQRLVSHALETLTLEKGSAIAIDMPMNVNSLVIYLSIVLAGYVVVYC